MAGQHPFIHNMPVWQAFAGEALWPPYTQTKTTPFGLPVERAEGVYITLSDGRVLLDGVSSWWSAVYGYCHPHIEKAVMEQLKQLPHIMLGGLQHSPVCRLASKLKEISPKGLSHIFFSESGSVAVEVAMKMSLQFWHNQNEYKRKHFISFVNAYHGDTFAAMAVCDPNVGLHHSFEGQFASQIIAPLPVDEESCRQLEGLFTDEVAAVLIEPLVQGAGGMKFHDEKSLRFICGLCAKHNVLLIADEIFVGLGRLGAKFACDKAGIVPDIMTVSKALTAGTLPMAATLAQERVYQAFVSDDEEKAFMHGPTYMGNALGCVAALASLELLEGKTEEGDILERVRGIEAQLRQELMPAKMFGAVRDVRVLGALGVIEVQDFTYKDLEWVKGLFLEEGVFVRPFGNIIYCTPSFIIEKEELSKLTTAMVNVARRYSEHLQA